MPRRRCSARPSVPEEPGDGGEEAERRSGCASSCPLPAALPGAGSQPSSSHDAWPARRSPSGSVRRRSPRRRWDRSRQRSWRRRQRPDELPHVRRAASPRRGARPRRHPRTSPAFATRPSPPCASGSSGLAMLDGAGARAPRSLGERRLAHASIARCAAAMQPASSTSITISAISCGRCWIAALTASSASRASIATWKSASTSRRARRGAGCGSRAWPRSAARWPLRSARERSPRCRPTSSQRRYRRRSRPRPWPSPRQVTLRRLETEVAHGGALRARGAHHLLAPPEVANVFRAALDGRAAHLARCRGPPRATGRARCSGCSSTPSRPGSSRERVPRLRGLQSRPLPLHGARLHRAAEPPVAPHRVPPSAGGPDEPWNRTTLCAFHHLRGIHAGTMPARAARRMRSSSSWACGRPARRS